MSQSVVPAWTYMHHVHTVLGGQKKFDPLKLELHMAVSCHLSARNQLRSSSRAAHACSYWDIPPVSTNNSFKLKEILKEEIKI